MYRFIKPATYAISGLLALLAVVVFGMAIQINFALFAADGTFGGYPADSNAERQLSFAVIVIIFLVALGVLARSLFVLLDCRSDKRVSYVGLQFHGSFTPSREASGIL